MIQLVYFEFRKIWKSKFFCGMFLFFLIVNGYRFSQSIFDINIDSGGVKTIYDETKGEITTEKTKWVIEQYQKLNKMVASGEYSMEGGQKGTYTGYIQGDLNCFTEQYEKLKEIYSYKEYTQKICEKSLKNIKNLREKNYSFGVKKYELIQQCYQGREITSYYKDEIVEGYFSYDFSTILMFLMLVIGLVSSLVKEKENHIHYILETTSINQRKVVSAQIISIFLLAFVIVTIFSLSDVIMIQWSYGKIENWFQPLYSLTSYKNTPLNITVLQFGVYSMIMKYCSLVFWGILAYGAFLLFVDGVKTILSNILVFLLSVIVCMNTIDSYFNPIALFNGQEMVKDCRIENILGIPIFYHEIVLGTIILITFILIILIIYIRGKFSMARREK